jgi:hypothetical protein
MLASRSPALVFVALLASTSMSAGTTPTDGDGGPGHGLPQCIGCQELAPQTVGPDSAYIRVWTGGAVGDPASYAVAGKIELSATLFTVSNDCDEGVAETCAADCDVMYSVALKVVLYPGAVDLSDVSVSLDRGSGDPLGSMAGPFKLGDIANGNVTPRGLAFLSNPCGDSSYRDITFALDWSTATWPAPLPPSYVPPHYFEQELGGVGPAPGHRIVGERPASLRLILECLPCVPFQL